jgi:hypothetical protein
MSKNSSLQTIETFKEWLAFMKIKPKKKLNVNSSGNTIGSYINK